MEYVWLIGIAFFSFIFIRFYKDIRLKIRLKKHYKQQINDIITNPKYKPRGKYE